MICPTCDIPCFYICPCCYESVTSSWHLTDSAKSYGKTIDPHTKAMHILDWELTKKIEDLSKELKETPFWKFKRKSDLKKEIESTKEERYLNVVF